MRRIRIVAVAAVAVVGLMAIGRYSEAERAHRPSSTASRSSTAPRRLPPFGGDATAAPTASARPAASDGTLPPGEYACVGSGGSILAGLGFKVDASGGYSDLDGTTHGTVSVSGSDVTFTGGHFSDTPGRNWNGKSFVVGSMASCEKWS